MAKDGTNRGGRRTRAGDKPDPLYEKLRDGRPARVMELPEFESELLQPEELDVPDDIFGEDMPAPAEYLSAKQKDGKPLGADKIYRETWRWLKARGCEKLVNPRLIEAHAQTFARYIQCEEATSTYGLLGKHPTTGGAMASPFVQMSNAYQKQANLLWYEIFDIVKQNCSASFTDDPQDTLMESLLSGRKAKK